MFKKGVEVSEIIKIVASYRWLSERHIQQIRKVSDKVTLELVGDKENLLGAVRDADIMLVDRMFDKEVFLAAKKLKWVHVIWAGVEGYLFPEFVDSPVILTSSSGVHRIPVSEMIIAMMLMLAKRLYKFMRFQLEGKWIRPISDELIPNELADKTAGILGLGNIGMETAWKAKCLGMKVLALQRKPIRRPTYVDEILGPKDLDYLLSESDYLIITVPLTRETYHMISEGELKLMKPSAYVINVSRGAIIDHAALIKALKEGWIAGAGLDVFEEEPLPEDSEFWRLENVVITPHISGWTPHYDDRVVKIFCENLARYLDGKPLINVVDKKAGY